MTLELIFAGVAVFASLIALLFSFRANQTSKQQFQFSVMISCIERFQEIIDDLTIEDDIDNQKGDTVKPKYDINKQKATRKYIDLCNEELFYFQNRFVPDVVEREWLEGMSHYLPMFNKEGENINPKSPQVINDKINDIKQSYPRLFNVFQWEEGESFDPDNETMRNLFLKKAIEKIEADSPKSKRFPLLTSK